MSTDALLPLYPCPKTPLIKEKIILMLNLSGINLKVIFLDSLISTCVIYLDREIIMHDWNEVCVFVS